MPQAARLYDPIGHSPTMNWLLRGAVIGAAIGLAAVAIVATGGLAAVAVVGGLAAGGAGIGEVLSTMSGVAKEVTGKIVGPCSGNVYTNGKRAARAHVDMTACTKHPPVPLPIATGSGNVYINGQPAARVGDTIVCSAVITDGSANVYIGGGSQQTDTITPEDLVPPEVHAVMLVVGIGSAVVLAGPIVAVAGLALGAAGGALGGWAGGAIFSEGSDGQKWSMLGGSLIGGLLGSKGGSVLAGKLIPKPTTPVGGFVKGGLPGMKDAAGNQAAAATAAAQDRLDKSLGANSVNFAERGAKTMNSSNVGWGIEKATPELIESVAQRRSVVFAKEGTEDMAYLDWMQAEANVGGETYSHILLRQNPSKAAVLEEFLHGTQSKLGIIDRLGPRGFGSAETHVKNFMMRHQSMLGLSNEDILILQQLRDAGL